MAEFDPRDGLKAPGFNTWGYAGVPKDNPVYELLDTIKEGSDAIFEVISFTFDLINTFLDFIASLLIDFTNPLKPIIEAIIALLEGFVEDLRNLGLYITFDDFKREELAEKMLGGYPAFEQRLIKKLLKNSDQTRPNFTPQTKVFAISLFVGADASGIKRILDAYGQLKKLFTTNTPPSSKPKAPNNVEAVFYNNVVGEIELPSEYKPDGIRVKWKLPPPASTQKAFPTSFILPDYFLFSIATRNAGDQVGYVNSVRREASDPKIKESSSKVVLNPVLENSDARLWPLYGRDGLWYEKLNQGKEYKTLDDALSELTFTMQRRWVLYNGDNAYLSSIEGKPNDEVYRVFIYEAGGDALIGDDDFNFDIPIENLKVNGQLEDEYFVTLYSMDASELPSFYQNDLPGFFRTGLQAEIEAQDSFFTDPAAGFKSNVLLRPFEGITTLSMPSEVVTIKTPTDLKSKYVEAVRFFFLGYALANLNGDGAKTLEITFTEEEKKFIKRFTKADDGIDALQSSPLNKQDFNKELLEWIDDIMINFKGLIPSEVTLNSQQTRQDLNKISEFKFDFYDLITTGAGGGSYGIYPNLDNWRLTETRRGYRTTTSVTKDERENGNYSDSIFLDADVGSTYTYGSFIDDSVLIKNYPVLFYPNGDLKYFGSVGYVKDFKENMLRAKKLIMLSAQGEATGEWIDIKPFREMDLSAITDFMDTVNKYLDGLLSGLEGIVAQILKYIHLLQTRIAQLQAVIARIKAMIDLILSFRFPAGLYGTFHLADGTGGLVNALVNSKDKPNIGVDGYGLGMMMVAGGVPSLLIDFFIALLGGESTQEGG